MVFFVSFRFTVIFTKNIEDSISVCNFLNVDILRTAVSALLDLIRCVSKSVKNLSHVVCRLTNKIIFGNFCL